MKEPRITVIIPTRERRAVLEKAIQTVTAQAYRNLQILVSDNFSSDGTQEFVSGLKDPRVRYVNTGRRLSMSHNWEFALQHVEEGWVTVIGDDDGLLPGSVARVASIIQSSRVKAIRSAVCFYLWPAEAEEGNGHLQVPLRSGSTLRSTRDWLRKAMNGFASYTDLPMLYNGGYVDVTVLNELRRRTGMVYRSCIPDVYSAVAIASCIDQYLYLREPLAINGASSHSTGTSYFSPRKNSEQSPARKFASEANIPFHQDVPLCADNSYPSSLQAMMYESYLQSAALRDASECTHASQLEVILATSGNHFPAVSEWGRLFAAAHGLDFGRIEARARRRKPAHHGAATFREAVNALNSFSLGNPLIPIRDVYAASVAAGTVRFLKPSRWKKVSRLVGQTRQKWVAR